MIITATDSNLSSEFIEYLQNLPDRPRVGRGNCIDIRECVKCALVGHGCLFGSYAARNVKRGYTKLYADMCAYRNGFHVIRSD